MKINKVVLKHWKDGGKTFTCTKIKFSRYMKPEIADMGEYIQETRYFVYENEVMNFLSANKGGAKNEGI